ncbi:MAG: glycoside hydrolase family 88 protein [Candidatus Pseudobacter hemicellulosilyticus]|uniref:Glycoside hydrolase family 88 protein n=1 Tax=Candidatus Pseudobacter hemicellulosilyticus TaxID=3121375 RepID=A0AAJ6BI05_9BACT|nr:MAG: glycoside hydrolase family 88 protein [Pseudobacter sp.]
MYKQIFSFLLLLPFQFLFAQKNDLTKFPKGYTPEEVGKLIAYRFVDAKHALHAGKWIGYPETFYWNGSLKYASLTKDKTLLELMEKRFQPLFTTENALLPIRNHVDLNMFGSLPLELYQLTKDKKYLDLGLPYATTQWEVPADAKAEEKAWAEKGYSWQTRLWIDDMYMITIVQSQAYKASGDVNYIDRAAKEMVMYLDSLQRPNGLFYHAPDVPYYWGRGNGWMAAGMAELLRFLPKDNQYRPRILKGYLTMMESLKNYQTEAGMWNQLIDEKDSWAETSGSAMFTYALITGVKQKWLNAKEYAPVARKAWMALVPYVNDKGAVSEVCVGTNKKNDKQYYYDRPRRTGDYHGQAPYLWCVAALLEK